MRSIQTTAIFYLPWIKWVIVWPMWVCGKSIGEASGLTVTSLHFCIQVNTFKPHLSTYTHGKGTHAKSESPQKSGQSGLDFGKQEVRIRIPFVNTFLKWHLIKLQKTNHKQLQTQRERLSPKVKPTPAKRTLGPHSDQIRRCGIMLQGCAAAGVSLNYQDLLRHVKSCGSLCSG